jgi:hypothetical protein
MPEQATNQCGGQKMVVVIVIVVVVVVVVTYILSASIASCCNTYIYMYECQRVRVNLFAPGDCI